MDESEQIIVQLAENCKKPDEFVNILENVIRVPSNEKGDLFLGIGVILHNHSYYALALNSWNHALEYFKKNQNKIGEANCYNDLGAAHWSLGNFRKAIELHENALGITKEIGDKSVEAKCYGNLGNNYSSLGAFIEAIKYYDKTLEIAKYIEDRAMVAFCYGNLGLAYDGLGDFIKALNLHEKSLGIVKEIGDNSAEASCYTNLGKAYFGLGDFRKVIEFNEKSLGIAKEIGNRFVEANCYTNLGKAYFGLGDFRKAIEFHEESLAIAKAIEAKSVEASCYTNMGNAYSGLGDFRKAIEFHEESLAIAKAICNKLEEAACYKNLGSDYYASGDLGEAIVCHEKSVEIAKEIGDKSVEASCYGGLGVIYRDLGDFRKAIEFNEKSLEIAKEIGNINLESLVNLNLSLIYGDSNRLILAYDLCKRSIELSETIIGRLVEEEHKIPFFASISYAYQVLIFLCWKLKKEDEAFEYVERSKSRAFLDLIAATEIKPSIGLTTELKSLLGDEENYLSKLREIQTRHLRPTKVSVEPGEVERIYEKLNLLYEKMKKFDPDYVFTRRGEPLSLSKVQDMLILQKRDMVLIEYFITKDKTFIFVVSSKDNKLHIVPVSISAEKLNRFVEVYWREVVNYSDFKNIGNTWLGLSEYLIEPITKYLTEGNLIYFVPYGSLHYLPIHALELNGEPLIKNHPVVYSQSASLIKFCQNKGSGKIQSCASFGAVFEDEAEGVAKLFNTEPYNNESATKHKVCENCTDKDVIHFSSHGYFDDLDPLSSGVELYDDVLTAREIFDMRLNTELVTLSACQTGLNNRSPGDELIGLTRAFLYAGAPSVIVSLWSVDARSTQELMIEFYTLLKNGADKASALQEAQKRIMEKEGYSHPYYWAPFVLVGDWE